MGVRRFKLTAKARQDLLAIGRYTEKEWGVAQRDRYLKQFDAAFNRLGENPNLGRKCDEILAGYRKIGEGSYVMFYKVSDVVEIVRILHQRMDPEVRLP